ncbi:hypothetical protein CDL12_29186 [Handroanthus impetiginosus]|uniref:CLAVATA3/ESR (CLE)-related protein 45 n=1 Tax=Handroanthus impetiginosus TaxID=429701 RepID=A0A2G9FZ39_9LAMI|nr:hypothetical protein CDL12_29186 [Handroanthus impetiginosus]
MQIQQSFRVGMLQNLLVLFLLVLLVSASENNNRVLSAKRILNSSRKLQEKQQQFQIEKQGVKHAFDAFFSSKRRVPHASDPLHNR